MDKTDSEKIISEMQEIIQNLQNNNKEEDVTKLSELLINYKFHKEMINDSEESENFSQKEMVKFLSLGWYVYTNLIPSN